MLVTLLHVLRVLARQESGGNPKIGVQALRKLQIRASKFVFVLLACTRSRLTNANFQALFLLVARTTSTYRPIKEIIKRSEWPRESKSTRGVGAARQLLGRARSREQIFGGLIGVEDIQTPC